MGGCHMEYILSRRHFFAAGAAGLASMAGCQAISASNLSVTIHIANATDQGQDAFVEITSLSDENLRSGQVVPLESGDVQRVHFSVPAGTYEMLLNLDDVAPRPEKTVEWEISNDECDQERYWVIQPSDTGPELQLLDLRCTS